MSANALGAIQDANRQPLKRGFYWHVRHDQLWAYCRDYDERADCIRRFKSAHEVDLRLKLFQPIRGELPPAVVRAWAAFEKAQAAFEKALAAFDKLQAAFWEAYGKAWAASEKALTENQVAIEALHAAECPNCPWNGKTIFPCEKGEKI